MRRKLKTMDPEEKRLMDHAVCEMLLGMPELSGVRKVYGYMSLSWETGTGEILKRFWELGIRTALPRVCGNSMDFFEVSSFSDLEEGVYHIPEPKADKEKVSWPDAPILVPGLAFSSDGNRLGKGGGYYDRFLTSHPGQTTVALAYEFQITVEIPTDRHDRPVNVIVTPEHIFRRQGGI